MPSGLNETGNVSSLGMSVEGVKELQAGYKAADKTLRKGVRDQLKVAGKLVSDEAKTVARAKGLVGSTDEDHAGQKGRLASAITPSVQQSGTAVAIRATAKRTTLYKRGGTARRSPNPYNYPKVFEYGGASHRMAGGGTRGKGRFVVASVTNRSKLAAGMRLGAGENQFTGSRAFMAPALKAKADEAAAAVGKALDEAAKAYAGGHA